MSLDGAILPPLGCAAEGCRSTALQELTDFQYHTELQEVCLQERNSPDSAAPATVDVLLLDELADRCKTGGASAMGQHIRAGTTLRADDVEVTGVVIQTFKPLINDRLADTSLVLLANNAVVLKQADKGTIVVDDAAVEDFTRFWEHHQQCPLQVCMTHKHPIAPPQSPPMLQGRNKILASMCPQIHGLFPVKLATAIMLAGGVAHEDNEGGHIRGEIHMLLVGDPGTGTSCNMAWCTSLHMANRQVAVYEVCRQGEPAKRHYHGPRQHQCGAHRICRQGWAAVATGGASWQGVLSIAHCIHHTGWGGGACGWRPVLHRRV